ncbi:hypothetical protein [Cellulomonas sp.]|uniref:hypothetical protein n=1 Tax=Cellulomonas sp. TaxID=40001 RepID=UPI00258AE7FA|nr:hypothetical protein [Cellulomonas sp.]MCR6690112.1 hypothetical protein [Cellulomonas sp.]
MAMTLRLTEVDQAALARLAEATHRSLNDAAALAIRETADRYALAEQFAVAIAEVEHDDAEALELLSR